MKHLKPVWAENLEDLHCEEPDFRRDLLHKTLFNPVQGGNLEDRPDHHHHHEELEFQRSAQ